MSRTAEEIGMIAGGIAVALAAGPIGVGLMGSLTIFNAMVGIGLTAAVAGAAGLLNPLPLDPTNIAPQGQLAVPSPNPLWRVVYGIFQFAGAKTFADGPILGWPTTPANKPCNHQFMNFVYTLTCHQIAGFLAVVLDGQTFNFGTDLVLLTPGNNPGNEFGPTGMWGFVNVANPWAGAIMFEFDCGDPGNASQPFPYLVDGASAAFMGPSTFNFDGGESYLQPLGSTRWKQSCLQRGRSKVHVLTHYSPFNDSVAWPALASAPSPYVMGGGRLPEVQFKIAGRIVLDYRVATAWQALTRYPQYTAVLAIGANGQVCIFAQIAGSVGVSAATIPSFASVAVGAQIVDGICTWLNAGVPIYAAGSSSGWPSGQTNLNNPNSNKLGGPGGTTLICDAWVGNMSTAWQDSVRPRVIEAPIGWLQMPNGIFVTGLNRPDFDASSPPKVGKVTTDALGSWTCLGRSKFATALQDPDGTWNTGGISNSALCVADYLTTKRAEFGLGATLTSDSINTIVAAANVCDEPVVIEVF